MNWLFPIVQTILLFESIPDGTRRPGIQLNYHRLPEKTTVYPKIFSTILLLAALPSVFAGEFATTGEASPGVPEKLEETTHRLVRAFRSPWRNSRTGLTVAFSPAVPEESAEVQYRNGRPTLVLNGSSDLRRSFRWRRKFYGAVLLAAAGAHLRSGESSALPAWLVSALDMFLEARAFEERLLIGNRRSPVLRALQENGRMPAAATVLRTDPENFDPAAAAWARELSRAMFFAGGRRLASPGYLRNCGIAAEKKTDPDLWWIGTQERLEKDFGRTARRIAWHELAPRPARWTRKKLAELRRVKLPVLDERGNPTANFEEFDVSELAQHLRDRPDAHERCVEIHRRFFDFCPGDSRAARMALSELAELVAQAEKPPFRHEARMRRQLEKIDGILTRQEKLDRYMKAEDARRAPARRAFRVRLEYIEYFNAASALSSGEARRWIDGVEAEFR